MNGPLVVTVIGYSLTSYPAVAQTRNWIDPLGGSYHATSNWSPADVPNTAGETAQFNIAGMYDVSFFAGDNLTINDLNIFDGSVSLVSSGPVTFNVDVATIAGGNLTLSETSIAGRIDLNASTIAVNAGSTLTFDAGSQSTTGTLQIGHFANNTIGVVSLLNGSTLDVTGGSDILLGVNSLGTSSMLVDGLGSMLTNAAALNVGNAGSGTLAVQNNGAVSNTIGILGSNSGSTGTATVDGAGSTWTNAGDLYVGSAGNGTLDIQNGGMVSNTDGFVGNDTGSIGTATVTGSGSTWTNVGSLEVGNSGQGTLNVEAGGMVSNTGGFIGSLSGSTGTATVTGSGSTWNNVNSLEVGGSGQGILNIEAGGMVSSLSGFIGSNSGSTGAATVTGSGSTWTNSDSLEVGRSGQGTLNVEAGGMVSSSFSGFIGSTSGSTGAATVTGSSSSWTVGFLEVGRFGQGTLNVEAGGLVSSFRGFISNFFGSTGTATVTGSGSTWTNTTDLFVGGSTVAAGGSGSLTVTNQGLVDVTGELKIWAPGTVNLDGGSIVTDTFDNSNGGTFNFLAGSLTINSGVNVGSGLSFPQNLTLGNFQTLITPASTTIAANRTLTLGGGTLRTNNLTVNGALQFNSGTLELTGGTVMGLTALTVPTGGTLRATGVYNLPVTAVPGSSIVATGDLTLGDATVANGFGSAGTLAVGANTVTLQDANEVVFDSLAFVSLGQSITPGTLEAANGLTLDFGGNLTGFGTVNTPNNAATPLINNGNIAGNSLAEPITLTGYVKGVGTCDNCNITGTDAPGFSPATVSRGSVSYNGTLEIELGGLSAGSEFDQLVHILGAGIADLGGTLDVQFINGFMPSAGDTFEIITAASVVDTFDTLNLPALPGDLLWFVNYGATSVELVSTYGADFDEDGDVDDFDLVAWEGGFGGSPAVHMTGDANADASASGFDFLTWQRQFGNGGGVPLAVASTVPEPTSLLLAALGLLTLSARRKRA